MPTCILLFKSVQGEPGRPGSNGEPGVPGRKGFPGMHGSMGMQVREKVRIHNVLFENVSSTYRGQKVNLANQDNQGYQ